MLINPLFKHTQMIMERMISIKEYLNISLIS